MSRYQQLFNRLSAQNEGAFVPFVVLGDPTYELSKQILITLIESGADALEVSIPFSDPLADGPEIQGAVLRAIGNGMSVEKSFTLLKEIRDLYPEVPIGLLMYANLIHAAGIDQFYAKCAKAGVDSVLVADVPLRESADFKKAATAHNIAPIFICPPDATDETFSGIAKEGEGYTYLVSRAGVTGVAQRLENDSLEDNIAKLKAVGAPPIVQGFGISSPEQAKHYLDHGVAGVISGSAVTQIIRENLTDESALLEKLGAFIQSMKAATK
ncbi:tryptophan synthase subunit alpha [Ignatzschineria rhizosphaerae]|uniref:Tryptophan synthase alpha chain n=1 Tax=Ignatzschineria rhizosphaerae TaxID=2923279 RepID=A0ABY3X573_9GAMM|nr:tryptophan synthase subunit alpha [Ignatzschineria rhizosphaerae]UNM96889.1 tryptophan synthase subunit alpha [Ignatzschineria rhizosphaerae]